MSYRGNNNAYNYNQGRNGWQGVPFNNAPSYQPRQYNQPTKKRSGSKSKRYTPTKGNNAGKGMIHTSGWRYTKQGGLIAYACNTTGKSKLTEKGWIGSIACEVTQVSTGQKSFYWGTMEQSTGKVVIQDLGIVINPKANNGGYCGTFINKRR